MAGFDGTLGVSASAMRAHADRLRLSSENIANADTPGYRRKTAAFEAAAGPGPEAGQVQAGPTRLDPSPLERVYDPAHPMAGAEGYYDGSNVDLVVEIADAREAQRSYEANLKMFDQVRQMSSNLLDILKR